MSFSDRIRIVRRGGNRIIQISEDIGAIVVIQKNRKKHNFLFDWTKENFAKVSRYLWHVHEGYCEATDEVGAGLSLTWVLFDRPPKGLVWHHIGGRCDNRAMNIRLITCSQNNYAKRVQKNRSTGIRGISKNRKGKFVALVGLHGKRKQFTWLKDAVVARRKFEQEMKESILNSPMPDNGLNIGQNIYITKKAA